MMIPGKNTLRFQLIVASSILFCVLIVLVGKSIKKSLESGTLSAEYIIKNKIIGHLNAAAGWHAIERGYGATILGDGKGDSSPFFTNFLEMRKNGDSEVFQAEKYIKELTKIADNNILEKELNKWREGYQMLLSARPKIASNDIPKEEWLNVTTSNINNEFDLRNVVFAAEKMDERIIYINNILIPNISKLCEFAGLERALIGNTIAAGEPISNESYENIKRYRTVVEHPLDQILQLKDLLSTSDQMKQALLEFEKEFLQSFQLLREDIFNASRKEEQEIEASSTQITKIKTDVRNCFSRISRDLLNISNHINVTDLSKGVNSGKDIQIYEQQSIVTSLFKFFSQVHKNYNQIQFIDRSGHERVRVYFTGDTTHITPLSQLKDESKKNYFNETINMTQGSVYISQIELNIVNGRVEIPYNHVIHFAAPVFVDGEQAGIVVFKVVANADNPFRLHIATDDETKEDYILADRDGFYVHHPDKAKEWGMMDSLNKSHQNIREDYPDVAEQILSGKKGTVHLASGKVIVYEPLFPEFSTDTDRYWVIIKQVQGVDYPVSASAWFAAATKAINTGFAISKIAEAETTAFMEKMGLNAKRSLQVNLFIFAFVILIFLLFIRLARVRILDPIKTLTRITQNIAEGDYTLKAEVESENEIGLLTSNFNKMAEGLTNEIVDRKHAEKSLRKSEENYRQLIEAAQDAIICTDEKGMISVWNKSAEKIFGHSKNEIIGQPITTIIPEKYHTPYKEGFNRLLNSASAIIIDEPIEASGMMSTGIEIPIEFSVSSYKTENEQLAFIGIVRDLTERKRIESALLQSEKMKSMGMITSGVSHEFNNILAIVKGFAMQIKKKSGDDKKLEGRADTIIKASNDGIEIVRGMRKYTNTEKDSTNFESTDVRDLVEQTIRFTMPRWQNIAHANGIHYNIDTDGLSEELCVKCKRSELREVLVNIINNALDAMPDGGSLFFRTGGKEDTVFVSISDTGLGMNENVQKKIFDPFFTTKVGVGSGLGMSTAYGIMTRHGGKIDVESEEGNGSTFTIMLPMSKETVRPEVTSEPEQEIKAEGLRILIVDDEQKICDLLSEYFLEDNHDVKCVNSGVTAIKLLETENFDLVLSDLVMPEVSGLDIVKAVRALEKKPKVGLITGWENPYRTEEEKSLKADFVVRKPIDFSKLTRCINNVLSKYSSYDIGIAELDMQHAEMDLLLSKLSGEDLSQDIKEETLELFRNTISSHFNFEENWAQTNGKPFDADHSGAHNKFLDLLNEMNTQYKNKQLSMNTISLTIKKELLDHVRNHDIKLNT
ncbi:MAG: PAS domain S-box protein [Candidatus Brocadiales bacterium]|nr:PAS domain S-box protein [Candidatus Brocadiales bacterium]